MAVVDELEVPEVVIEDARRSAPEPEMRQRVRGARQLQVGLLEVIDVQVAIAARPDELPGLEVALLREHVGEERVAGDVEGDAEKEVAASLVHLQRQPAGGDVQLEQQMTGRKR